MKTLSIVIAIILLIVPFIAIALFWGQIPDTVPTHYNFKGEPDAWGSKSAVFILPAINMAMFILLLLVPRIDPKKRVDLDNQGYMTLVMLLVAFFFCLFGFQFLGFLEMPVPQNYIIYMFPVLFLVLGNYLTKVKPNYFIGVRTPWTLENEDVWRLTHRFTGRLWMITSLIFLVLMLLLSQFVALWMVLTYIAIVSIVPLVYSYMAYQKQKQAGNGG